MMSCLNKISTPFFKLSMFSLSEPLKFKSSILCTVNFSINLLSIFNWVANFLKSLIFLDLGLLLATPLEISLASIVIALAKRSCAVPKCTRALLLGAMPSGLI